MRLQQLPQLHPARARWAHGRDCKDAHSRPMQGFEHPVAGNDVLGGGGKTDELGDGNGGGGGGSVSTGG